MKFLDKQHIDKVMQRKQRIKDNKWRYNQWSNNRIDIDKAIFQNQSLVNYGAIPVKEKEKQKGFEYNWGYKK